MAAPRQPRGSGAAYQARPAKSGPGTRPGYVAFPGGWEPSNGWSDQRNAPPASPLPGRPGLTPVETPVSNAAGAYQIPPEWANIPGDWSQPTHTPLVPVHEPAGPPIVAGNPAGQHPAVTLAHVLMGQAMPHLSYQTHGQALPHLGLTPGAAAPAHGGFTPGPAVAGPGGFTAHGASQQILHALMRR